MTKQLAACLAFLWITCCDHVVTPDQHDQCIKAADEKTLQELEQLCPDRDYVNCPEGPSIERRYWEAVKRCSE